MILLAVRAGGGHKKNIDHKSVAMMNGYSMSNLSKYKNFMKEPRT